MTKRRLRRPGSPWRILVHQWVGAEGENGLKYGRAYHVSNDLAAAERGAETARRLNETRGGLKPSSHATAYTVLQGTEFDELVVGKWIHLEQMDAGKWWMNVGGVTISITADREGRPRRVDVYGPGDYADPAEGCEYTVTWSAPMAGGDWPMPVVDVTA